MRTERSVSLGLILGEFILHTADNHTACQRSSTSNSFRKQHVPPPCGDVGLPSEGSQFYYRAHDSEEETELQEG